MYPVGEGKTEITFYWITILPNNKTKKKKRKRAYKSPFGSLSFSSSRAVIGVNPLSPSADRSTFLEIPTPIRIFWNGQLFFLHTCQTIATLHIWITFLLHNFTPTFVDSVLLIFKIEYLVFIFSVCFCWEFSVIWYCSVVVSNVFGDTFTRSVMFPHMNSNLRSWDNY